MSHSHGMYFDKSRNVNHAVALSAVIDGCRECTLVNVHAEMHIFNLWHRHIHFSLDTTPSLGIKTKQIFE